MSKAKSTENQYKMPPPIKPRPDDKEGWEIYNRIMGIQKQKSDSSQKPTKQKREKA